MITTDTHVFFWSGPLSNWHRGRPFPGARAYALTVARLDALGIDHPSDAALSSRLLREASFGSGEQWMMSTKAWLFDRSAVSLNEDPAIDAAVTLRRILETPHPERMRPLGQVLATSDPRAQKAIGRRVEGFDETVWARARVACVTAGTIARMEADPAACRILTESGDRIIVEGSPHDRVWGVGLRFDDPAIRNPANWRGDNLLGVSHGEARTALASRAAPASPTARSGFAGQVAP